MSTEEAFSGLEPAGLWRLFSALVRIPRPSGQEAAVAEWITHWADSHGFAARRDAVGNLCVSVPAADGVPGSRAVALQAHLDMVCASSEGVSSDPVSGSIEIARDGEWVTAPHSTLGADNGIGIVAAMSLAEMEGLRHGPLELLFTVEEETTSKGADGLDPDLIRADVMLNLDAESSGVLEIGCAGSAWTILRWSAAREPVPDGWQAIDIRLSGLRGGHSGIDIAKGRLNAIKGLVGLLHRLADDTPIRLCRVEGGSAFNAIPIRAQATVACPDDRLSSCLDEIAGYAAHLARRVAGTEPDLSVEQAAAPGSKRTCWADQDGLRLLDLLQVLPSGVLAVDPDLPGQVETSSNVGIVTEVDGVLEVHSLARSSIASAMDEVVASVRSAARLAGAQFHLHHPVTPPWRVAPDSIALRVLQRAYRDLFGHEPRLVTVHGAAESAILAERLPRLDIVSLGPEIQHAHVPGERVNIRSVVEFYRLLCEVVVRLSAAPG